MHTLEEARTGIIEQTWPTFKDRLAVRERSVSMVPASELRTRRDVHAQFARLERIIGNTPLTSEIAANGCTLWIKNESENPSGSHYDRATLAVFKRLYEANIIKPGDTILEGTSGSAGRSFAYFCNRLGFKLDMIVPHESEMPEVRLIEMKDFGTNVIHASERGGIGKVTKEWQKRIIELNKKCRRDPDHNSRQDYIVEGKSVYVFKIGDEVICAPNHSEIDITPRAFGDIAREVIEQLPPGTKIDAAAMTLGNGATVKGISEVLRDAYGDVLIYGTEYQSSPTNAIRKLRLEVGESRLREEFLARYGYLMPEKDTLAYHDSFGASTPGYEPPFVEVDKIDDIIIVGDEWREMKRLINLDAWLNVNPTGIIGNTSAENKHVARMLAKSGVLKGKNILVLQYDKGDQYEDWPPDVRDYSHVRRAPPAEIIPYRIRTMQKAA